jgi:PERQ amino acid-rich with GYF domain-containing protein
MILPLEPQIITEVIYTSSTTMDARHFAEEFIRRKKLADKGVVEKASTASATGSIGGDSSSGSKNVAGAVAKDAGGWSEVAKKGSGSGSASTSGGQRDDGGIPGASVKVVQGKRKGRK